MHVSLSSKSVTFPFHQVFFFMSWKSQMLFLFIKLMMIWCFPTIALCLYCLFFFQTIGATSKQPPYYFIIFINKNSILYENQFGFQNGKSTHFAIMLLIDKITEALDRGVCLIGVFLDFFESFRYSRQWYSIGCNMWHMIIINLRKKR